jgi:FkbH-like protein
METPEIRQEIDAAIARSDTASAAKMLKAAWDREPGASMAGFVAARFDRIRAQLGFSTHRLAILRSFTVEPVVPILRAMAYSRGIALDTQLGEFNAYAQEMLDSESTLYRFRPDVVILAVQTRDVASDLWRGDGKGEGVLARFGDWIASFRKHSAAALVVHTLEAPAPSAGILDGQQPESQTDAVRCINAGLRSLARQHRGVYVLDYGALVARHGRDHWGDERKWLTLRLPLSSSNLTHLAAEWMRFLHPLTGKLAKCVAVDLDNTLWGGVIGEDGMNGIRLGGEYPGAAYQEMQRALKDLTRRGILLAVCSKNNPADALEAIDGHPGMVLKSRDFAATRINWAEKAHNLREIAAELNIGLDSVAFLDDNPVERQHIREQAPEAIVLDLPEDPMQYARVVRDCGWFERLTLSEEDRQRGEFYAAQRERSEMERTVSSKEDFYRSLDQAVEISPVNGQTLARVAQLTQKTNQFNLTTRRYSEQQVEQMMASPEWRVWSLRVTDRYADNGLVGVAIAKVADEICEIDSFLMSCRVIGRTVETALLARVAGDARDRGAKVLQGWFLPTKKNAPAQDFYREHGFHEAEKNGDGVLWKLDLTERTITVPEWIRLTC